MANKIFVVGLDGATFTVLDSWMKTGKLPNLARLTKDGTHGELESTFPPVTPVAWASFITGKNPGKHGIFDFQVRESDSYAVLVASRRLMEGESLWKLLSREGFKVGVIGVPMTYPPEKVNGFLIPGILTPMSRLSTYPPELLDELEREIPDFLQMFEHPKYIEGGEDVFLRKWHHISEIRSETTHYLMGKYKWDFFMLYFLITDQVQHFFWKYMDSQHPAYDPQKARKYGNAILEAYQKVDEIIGKILKKISDDTVVIIMSDHGFGPVYKDVFINHYLEKLGLLKFDDRSKQSVNRYQWLMHKLGLTQERFIDLFSKLGLARLMEIVPYNMSVRFFWGLPTFRHGLCDIDYHRTKAYSKGYVGQIFINVKGRDPEGTVNPGEEYEELSDYLTKKLYELEDPQTGERIIDEIFRREDLYKGPHVNKAADLTFVMRNFTYITRGAYEFNAQKQLMTSPNNLESAWHRMNGVLIIAGSQIKSKAKVRRARIVDLAPTILHMMECSVPLDIDGRVIKEIFEPKSDIAKREVRYQRPAEKTKERYPWSKEEEEEIKERLRKLGYLD